MHRPRTVRLTTAMAAILLVGCQDRALEVAEEAATRQAEQNRTMAQLHRDVSQGTRELLSAESASRRDQARQAQALVRERSQLHTDWDELESERIRADEIRRRRELLATSLKGAGAVLAAVVALAFAWLALAGAQREPATEAALELVLLDDFMRDPPVTGEFVESATGGRLTQWPPAPDDSAPRIDPPSPPASPPQ